MKKYLPFFLIIIAAVGIGYSFIKNPAEQGTVKPLVSATLDPSKAGGTNPKGVGLPNASGTIEGAKDEDADDTGINDDVKPAAVAYKNAEEALEAIKKGAGDYDDTILEQFTQPGEDCTWCPQLYTSIKDLLKSDVKNETKSYYAEILAISGRVDNVQSLIDGFKNAPKAEDKEIYSSALELVTGKDDVVTYLGTELKTDNPDLKESVVAAITNQGSPLALETLYKSTVDSGDPDGYYSMGIGIGEMILDEQSLPKAQEYAQKKDAFAPLAVKALLNSGINGLRIVMDILANSTDPEADRKLIKDAVDHVNYDEEVEKYLKDKSNASQTLVKEFSNQILADFSQQEDNTDANNPGGTGGTPPSMSMPAPKSGSGQ